MPRDIDMSAWILGRESLGFLGKIQVSNEEYHHVDMQKVSNNNKKIEVGR